MRALKKKPVQIYLDEKQDDALDYFSHKLRVSRAELIRRSINDYLKKVPVDKDPALEIVGLGKSGVGKLAKKHDQYLIELEGRRRKAK